MIKSLLRTRVTLLNERLSVCALRCIRLRKFTPQASLSDICVREADWQKDDQMPIEHDDQYAQSWNTKIGPNPFEDSSQSIHKT